jgi:hypothetical protein
MFRNSKRELTTPFKACLEFSPKYRRALPLSVRSGGSGLLDVKVPISLRVKPVRSTAPNTSKEASSAIVMLALESVLSPAVDSSPSPWNCSEASAWLTVTDSKSVSLSWAPPPTSSKVNTDIAVFTSLVDTAELLRTASIAAGSLALRSLSDHEATARVCTPIRSSSPQ